MSVLTLKKITLEGCALPSHLLEGNPHLMLELNLGGQVIDRVNLLSRESSPGTWDADQILILREIDNDFTLFVFLEGGGEDRHLLGHKELSGLSLNDRLGGGFEIPLMADEVMVLKTKVEAMSLDDALKLASGIRQANDEAKKQTEIKNRYFTAVDRLQDYEQSGNLDSLEQATSGFQFAADGVFEDNPNRPIILSDLGACIFRRFERLGRIGDLENAIVQLRTAVDITPDGHFAKLNQLNNLGAALLARFECFGNIEDINNAIIRQQAAVDLTPEGHPGKPARLNNLGNSFLTRFKRMGNSDDLDNAIVLQQAAVHLTPDSHLQKQVFLNNLGNSLLARFEHFGNIEDIKNAIVRQQEAVSLTPDGHPWKASRLTNLATSLQTRFEHYGNIKDIDLAILRQRAATGLTPDGHPQKPDILNNLGNALLTRFERFGNIEDIDDAIVQQRAAVGFTPDRHPHKPSRLDNLGNSLLTRFKRFGNIQDIEDAVVQQQLAVDLTPDGDPDKPTRLSNFGTSLQARFERFKNVEDIDTAIVRQQAAVDLTPDRHPQKPKIVNNLGNSLLARFEHFGKIEDIDNAILRQEAAVDLTPEGHPDKPIELNNLGISLRNRFERFRNIENINRAIEQQSLAIDITPDGHPDRSGRLLNLGNSFHARFSRLHHRHDAETAISYLSSAAVFPVGPPPARLKAAKSWIRAASMIDHSSLLAAYECTLSIVPLVAWLGLSITDRHQHLVQTSSIARDAAAAAICLQQYDKAVEWLEQGRSIVWTQILQLRTPVDDLHDVNPELAANLLRVSQSLDSGIQQGSVHIQGKLSREEEGRRYRALAAEWGEIVKKIRELAGFQDFLRPPRFSRLIGAARNGPIVVVNIAKKRCDALVLIDGIDEVMHIPLPDMTLEKATRLQATLLTLLKSSNVRVRAKRDPDLETGGDAGCKLILGELWDCLVKPVLDSLAFSPHPDRLPRIWWCVTGPLAFLPIHAAGIYDDNDIDNQIYNYVISSYIPTLSALLEPARVTVDPTFRMLSVIEPSTRGWYIPNTKVELEHIRRRLNGRDHTAIVGPDATKERVLKAVEDCHWLHLACHGSQEVHDPTKSGLKLRDGNLTLAEIVKLKLPKAEFAFLSACQTVTGDEKLSEEAVHIAGGMLLAGYRSVVATMWSIEDKLAPVVADEFYGHMMKEEGRPDSRKAAEALHLSVAQLRKRPGISMVAWIPFVHIGI